MMPDTHTQSCPPLILRVHQHAQETQYTLSHTPRTHTTHTHTHSVHTHTHSVHTLTTHSHTPHTHVPRTRTPPRTHSCLMAVWLMMAHTYTPIPMPTLDCLHKHLFLLHAYRSVFSQACSDTHNLHTYFTSMRRVCLVETSVLQTVRWDIRPWSARFLVNVWTACFLFEIILIDQHIV